MSPITDAVHVATAVVLAWGALAFGAVYSWAFWPLAVASGICGAAGLRSGRGSHGLPSARLIVWLALIAVAALAQVVPISRGLHAVVSPRLGGLLSELDILYAAGEVSRHALSIAPWATLAAIGLYVAFVVLMLGVACAASSTGPRRLAALIAGLGLLLAVIGIVQKPLYTGKVYGMWTPLMASSPFGPFINKNHFAGWMLMGLPLTLGLLCATFVRAAHGLGAGWRRRIVWFSRLEANSVVLLAAIAVVMGLSLVLTMSRSGMLAFIVAIAMAGRPAMRRLPSGSRRLVVAGCMACMVALVVGWAGVDAIAARFSSADPATVNERLPIWRDAWSVIQDFWLTGTGLNTYGVATLFYQTSTPMFHLREAHNDYLQLAAEGGLLLAVPVLCAIAMFALDVRRQFQADQGSTYWIRLGAVTGIVAAALQATVEFSLQMPGNAALLAVLCGIALHRAPGAGVPAAKTKRHVPSNRTRIPYLNAP